MENEMYMFGLNINILSEDHRMFHINSRQLKISKPIQQLWKGAFEQHVFVQRN